MVETGKEVRAFFVHIPKQRHCLLKNKRTIMCNNCRQKSTVQISKETFASFDIKAKCSHCGVINNWTET